jgi:hypothetical protein
MKPLRKKANPPEQDEVDRAVAAVEAAVGRLARLMYTNDLGVVLKVGAALASVGEFAAGPVARAVKTAPCPEHRMALLVVLEGIYTGRDLTVSRLMLHVLRKDPDERVKRLALSVLSTAIDREFVARYGAKGCGATGPVDGFKPLDRRGIIHGG